MERVPVPIPESGASSSRAMACHGVRTRTVLRFRLNFWSASRPNNAEYCSLSNPVALNPNPPDFSEAKRAYGLHLALYEMDNTKIVHAEQYDLACNWKMIADNVITLKRGFASAGRLFFRRVRSCTRLLQEVN